MGRGFLRSRMLVRSLRWVPRTAPLLKARTKRLNFGLSAHGSFGREDRRNRRKKKAAFKPRPARQGLKARTARQVAPRLSITVLPPANRNRPLAKCTAP